MTRDRIARLTALRARALDAAALALEETRVVIREAERTLSEVSNLLRADHPWSTSDLVAGELDERSAHLHALGLHGARLRANVAEHRAEEAATRLGVVEARVALEKMRVLRDRAELSAKLQDNRVEQGETDERSGAEFSRRAT